MGGLKIKTLNNIKYYSSTEVANLIGKSRQTIVNWDKYSYELEAQGKKRLIPSPLRIRKNKNRYWSKEQIEEIRHFRDNIKHGDMAVFNRRLWN